MSDLIDVRAGFIPLLDAAVLIVAHEKGFAQDQGLRLHLVRETSWANIRDKLVVGHFEMAHMLAPMPVASALGLTPFDEHLIAPIALGLGGNAVTVSAELWKDMGAYGAQSDLDPKRNGAALAACAKHRASEGKPLRFGVVHPHSSHNLELRYWLAACGVDPDKDVEIGVMPPSLLPAALNASQFDGFSVGEPWNSVAVGDGAHLVTVKSHIWHSSPEKVISMRRAWADENLDTTHAIVRAIYLAAQWCSDPKNHAELISILARQEYLNCAPNNLKAGLSGQLEIGGGQRSDVADFFVPFANAANFPWVSHALWFYSQLVRWQGVQHSAARAQSAAKTYRPDIYRDALAPLGVAVPSANSKVEGALKQRELVGASHGAIELGPDGFFDGRTFDPENLGDYIAAFSDIMPNK